jgi:hypothetical protein
LQLPDVPVTVYVVVAAGLADTVAPVVEPRPVAGDHVYVVPPLAVRFTLLPLHTESEGGTTVMVGVGLTVTTTDCESTQPFLVPVTQYVVVAAGDALVVAAVVELRPVDGNHE